MRRVLGGLAAVMLMLPGAARAAEEMFIAERIAAVINDEIILTSEVKDRAALLGQPIDEGRTAEEQRKGEKQLRPVLDRMIDDVLILQQATELKLSIEQAELDRAADEVKKQNNLTDQQFAEALGQQGFTLDAYRRELRKQLLRFKVINTAVRSHVNVTDEDVRAFYDQSVRSAGGARSVHVRHILVALTRDADPKATAERRHLAGRLVEEARAGKDFAELAKHHSDDQGTREEGGDLGWLTEGSSGLADKLAEVVFAMDTKEVRGPIRTDRGFEIVQVMEKKDSDARPFEEVKEQIRQQLSAQQVEKQTQSWLTDLRKRSHIDIRL